MRITPACAGKTSRQSATVCSAADHPRVCGENHSGMISYGLKRGSPPRVRGKQTVNTGTAAAPRITPACAGKTVSSSSLYTRRLDHPRVCGENVGLLALIHGRVGSPPRVRGKLHRTAGRRSASRITPACAGKTGSVSYRKPPRADHPRVCGENKQRAAVQPEKEGSPPRVRGKLQMQS